MLNVGRKDKSKLATYINLDQDISFLFPDRIGSIESSCQQVVGLTDLFE
jgi:hypothetical protein